jgi:hypothetical protein
MNTGFRTRREAISGRFPLDGSLLPLLLDAKTSMCLAAC